jgi:hypothetical protein
MVPRQERLAAVDQLSAGIADDFNNILTIIHHAISAGLTENEPAFSSMRLSHARIDECIENLSVFECVGAQPSFVNEAGFFQHTG